MAIKFNNKDVNSVLLRDGRVVNKVQILNGTVV